MDAGASRHPPLTRLHVRSPTAADAESLVRAVAEGLEEYRSFAPEGWRPPALAGEAARLRVRLARPDVWCRLAELGGRVVGQVTVLPAAAAARPVEDPRLAHLANLFLRRDFWGSGLASALHAAAVDEARDRGFAQMRLFAASAHRRARRFYEREGWVAVGDEFHDAGFGLLSREYRHALGRGPS